MYRLHGFFTQNSIKPAGRVPVLEHDGEFLFESGAICRCVASVTHSPLFSVRQAGARPGAALHKASR